MATRGRGRSREPGGFTLVELLVVLTILTLLAGIAVRSVGGLQERTRFEATQRVLTEVEGAVLGRRSTDAAGTFQAGFLSDIGRLPVPDSDPMRALAELWEKPAALIPNQIAHDQVDPEIVLPVGWRGPYLDLAPGATRVTDGYGNPLVVSAGANEWSVRSLGADALAGGVQYDADLVLAVVDPSAAVDRIHAELAGTVTVQTAPAGVSDWTVTVFAYGPDPQTGKLVGTVEDLDSDTPDLSQLPVTFHYRFSGTNSLTAGTRAVRAYVHRVGVEPRMAGDLKRSATVTRVLVQGAQVLDLVVN